MSRPRVVLLRGHQANPWDLRPWELLSERFDVAYVVSKSNRHDVESLDLQSLTVGALRDRLPSGRGGDLAAAVVGDRYLGIEKQLDGAQIVHAAELGYWFSAQAAALRNKLGFKLVLTVWETIPFLDTYRRARARRNRDAVLDQVDLFLAATERARDALLLEGADPERVEVCQPGIDLDRFTPVAAPDVHDHLILSPGRLVWEKGHQDVLRALAALKRGLVALPEGARPRLLIVGSGPEHDRLREHAAELGVADRVEFREAVPYDQMPDLYRRASCMVLASLPAALGGLATGRPTIFWEEQFGMVLAEAMASGLPIVAARSGAIPEVAGSAASYFEPGGWMELAGALAEGPLSRPPGERVEHPHERTQAFSTRAAAARLAAAYDRLLSG